MWCDAAILYTRASAHRGAIDRTIADVFRREGGLNLVPSVKDRVAGWRYLKNLIAWKKDEDGDFAREPSLYYVRGCDNFEREMIDAVHSEQANKRDDIDDGCSDHMIDSVRYYVMGSRAGRRMKVREERTGLEIDALMRNAHRRRLGLSVSQRAPMIQVA